MSEYRYDKLLNGAIVLLIVSATVLGYSVYNTHFSKNDTQASSVNPAIINNLRDSLKNVYANTVTTIDTSLIRTNAQNNPDLDFKYKEVESLKAEINELLKSKGEGDMASAKQKIETLKQKITELEIRYDDAATQNIKLQSLLEQLKRNRNSQTDNSKSGNEVILENQLKKAEGNKNTTTSITVSTAKINKAAEMHFFATYDTDKQTTKATDAEKLEGDFLLKYVPSSQKTEDVYIIIIKPNGSTIKGTAWEIGTFNSDEGKKVFTKKIPVELDGENKLIKFSVSLDEVIAGPYKMEVWFRTNMIGNYIRTLR